MINYKKSKTFESIIIIPNLFSNEILNFSQLVQITCHYVEIINRLLNVGLSFLIFYDCATPVGINGEKGPFSEGKVIAKTHFFFFEKLTHYGDLHILASKTYICRQISRMARS